MKSIAEKLQEFMPLIIDGEDFIGYCFGCESQALEILSNGFVHCENCGYTDSAELYLEAFLRAEQKLLSEKNENGSAHMS